MMQPLHHIIIHWGIHGKMSQLLLACNTEVKQYIQSGGWARSAVHKIEITDISIYNRN